MSRPRGIGLLATLGAIAALLALPAGASARDCVHVRTGEPLDCDELGAVTKEVYDQSPLRDDEGGGSQIPWDAIVGVVAFTVPTVLIVGAIVLWRRRRRQRAPESAAPAKPPPAPSPAVGATAAPGPAGGEVGQERTGTPDLVAAAERARAAHRRPAPAAGWYPDPSQPQTQRYWTGAEWTEQRAPLGEPKAVAGGLRFGQLITLLGCLAVGVGVFLPHIDAPGLIPVEDNSLVQGDPIGWLPLIAAIGLAGSVLAEKNYRAGAVVGLLIVGFAIFLGTGDRLALEYTGPASSDLEDALGGSVDGKPGIGLFVLGAGGLLMVIGSLIED